MFCLTFSCKKIHSTRTFLPSKTWFPYFFTRFTREEKYYLFQINFSCQNFWAYMIDTLHSKKVFSPKDCNCRKMPPPKKCTWHKNVFFPEKNVYTTVYLIGGETFAFIYFRSKSAQVVFQKTLNLTWKAKKEEEKFMLALRPIRRFLYSNFESFFMVV